MSLAVYITDGEQPKLWSSEPAKPSTKCTLEYLNEGGANFVFRMVAEPGQELPLPLKGHLLRLRKDLPHVQSANEQVQAFNSYFKPLFDSRSVIEHHLIAIDEYFSEILDEALKSLDREARRLNDFLPPDETHGLLVTDMTPKEGDVLLQVKPKWLTQSPNAPSNAKRCRTCALRAQRASKQIRTATDATEHCPLELISEKSEDRKKAAQNITQDEQLRDYLTTDVQLLLQTLRSSQKQLDPLGILGTHVDDMDAVTTLCRAMTLRDCTLFLKRSGDGIDARLADLDLKTAEKLDRWADGERKLISDGWYTNEEAKDIRKREVICLLSR